MFNNNSDIEAALNECSFVKERENSTGSVSIPEEVADVRSAYPNLSRYFKTHLVGQILC